MAKVIWWGRSDLNYSRNRICRQLLQALGYQLIDFAPRISAVADIEAQLKGLRADLVWVPCFRHRDMAAAARWARKNNIPLLFDPLISAWQKQVFERQKISADGLAANRLLNRESQWLQSADMILLDTEPQRQMFIQRFKLSAANTACVYVGAEQPLFSPAAAERSPAAVEILFYGSFIALHGVQTVIEAARLTRQHSHIHWVLLGDGPFKASTQQLADGLKNVRFESSLPYTELPQRIAQADIVLGVFGDSEKASQVIPNKVFQALACGRPVITRASAAYPADIRNQHGLWQIDAANPLALSDAVWQWSHCAQAQGQAAHVLYTRYFSPVQLQQQLRSALHALELPNA